MERKWAFAIGADVKLKGGIEGKVLQRRADPDRVVNHRITKKTGADLRARFGKQNEFEVEKTGERFIRECVQVNSYFVGYRHKSGIDDAAWWEEDMFIQ